MFQLFRRPDPNVYAPVSGRCMDVGEVEDKVFASKAMGDGFAVEPEADTIASPCDGTITMVFDSGHAFGVRMKDGKDIFVHIGIDTVNLQGKGFTVMKKKGDKVKHGDPVIKLDSKFIKGEGYPITTMTIINETEDGLPKQHLGEQVTGENVIIAFD